VTALSKKKSKRDSLAAAHHETELIPSRLKSPKVQQHEKQKHTAQPKRVVAPKVQAQQTQVQQSTYNPQDIKLPSSVGISGIHVKVLHINIPLCEINLLAPHYSLWNAASPDAKYAFVYNQLPSSIFLNDISLMDQVTLAVCNIISNIFVQAAQAAQAKRVQAQRR
jgi:hypothetical protein